MIMTAYVLCGIQGSGKSTLAHQLAEQHNAAVHSVDDIPNAWGNHDMDGNIRKQWMENVKVDLQNGKSVICDSLALTIASRKWILKELSGFNCEKILCIKAVPVEVCLQRNENRGRKVPDGQIRFTASMLEPPAKDEGWDKIYVCKD